jgi:hypothetical protein
VRLRLGGVLPTAIVMGFGFITLLGLLVGSDLGLLSTLVNNLLIRELTTIFLQITTITIALTVLIGVLNLLFVHFRRVGGRDMTIGTRINSIVLILSFAAVIVTYIVQRPLSLILLEDVQVSIESALAGLLLFALVYGAATVTRRRTSWAGVLFVLTILIVLIGAIPLSQLGIFTAIGDWLMQVPVNAGARGILLGIALATIVAGVRVLIGQDRSYRE